jgi:hypothetical protein
MCFGRTCPTATGTRLALPERIKVPIPKEHGASAVLCASFLAGLAAARQVNFPVFLLFVSFSAFYFAQEPMARIIQFSGRPGVSRRGWWQRWLAAYLAAGMASGAALVLAYGLWMLVPLGALAAALIAIRLRLLAQGKEMTLAGEVLSLAGLAVPAPAAYYVARGQFGADAALLWLAGFLFFGSGIFHVRMLLGRVKRGEPAGRRLRQNILYHLLLAAALLLLVWSGSLSVVVSLAFLPLFLRTLREMLSPSRALNLKKTGLLEMAYSIGLILLVALAW